MTTTARTWVFGLVVLLLAGGPRGVSGQAPRFPSEVERVTVDVVVTEGSGAPVRGLAREDFEVAENGVPQSILDFEAVDVAAPASIPPPERPRIATNTEEGSAWRSFAVVFDDLNLSPSSAEHARRALARFLEGHLREGDRVLLAPTGGGAWWSGRVARDRDDLLAVVRSLEGRRLRDAPRERMSDHEAMLIEVEQDQEAIRHVTQRFAAYGLLISEIGNDPARAPIDFGRGPALVRTMAAQVHARTRDRIQRTLASLERAMAALGGGRDRRSVVLVSDGMIRDERIAEFRQVLETARRTNAVIYFVDARGLRANEMASGPELPMPIDPSYFPVAMAYAASESAGAEGLALDTGGLVVQDANDLAAALHGISRESRAFYLLGYEPTDKRLDGRFRRIEVRVRRPGVVVRARKGYYAGGTSAGKAPPKGGADPAVLRALDAPLPHAAIPLRMAAYVAGAADAGRATVVLTAEADPAAIDLVEREGRLEGTLETVSLMASRDTGELGRRERLVRLRIPARMRRQIAATWVPVSHRFELAPGRYQASLAVRDPRGGGVGSVRLELDVPVEGGLRITTPILTDAMERGPGDVPVPVPIARRSFAAGSRLVCAFGVEGSRRDAAGAPQVHMTYEVRRGDGTIVTSTAPTRLASGAEGPLSGTFTMTLHRPGAYELRIRARDEVSGLEASTRETFVVEDAAP